MNVNFNSNQLQSYFIAGTQNVGNSETALLHLLKNACCNGITMFQFREKDASKLDYSEKIALGRKIKEITTSYHIPLIVDDDLQLAELIHADGIHVGQSDMRVQTIINKWPHKIIGLSINTLSEVLKGNQLKSIDYFGVGPVFPTTSKPDAQPSLGLRKLQLINQTAHKPVVAIGGIHESNVKEVLKTGVSGIATISAITTSNNLSKTIKILKGAI